MAVRVPARTAQVNFHIAGTRRVIADLQDRAAKIRAALGVGKAGMQDADYFSVRGFERVALKALMLPDGLQEPFGRRIAVMQHASGAVPQPGTSPVGVKNSCRHGHRGVAFAPIMPQSQAGTQKI